jgi:hypothetical protein
MIARPHTPIKMDTKIRQPRDLNNAGALRAIA